MIEILKKIKKLKVKELKHLEDKLRAIQDRRYRTVRDKGFKDRCAHDTSITWLDLIDAISFCIYHFKGGMTESLGLEICPCNCYCISCEMIPESAIPKRMQELAKNMDEEDVMNEFINQYCTKDQDGNIKLTGR